MNRYAKVAKSTLKILEITDADVAPELSAEDLAIYQIIQVGPHANVGEDVRLNAGAGEPPHARPETHPLEAEVTPPTKEALKPASKEAHKEPHKEPSHTTKAP